MTGPEHLLHSLRVQARSCTALGSPMYGELLDRIAADVETGGIFAEVLAGHEQDPGPSGLGLRLLGGLHRVVLDGRVPGLRRWYPSVGGCWDANGAWPDITATARSLTGELRDALGRPPQTNEVGRSAALLGGLLILADRFPLPIRLFEIGASAGLNLRADRYLYRYSSGQWGPADSPVVIDDAWHGRVPPGGAVDMVERQGYDIAPVDIADDEGEQTLLSYVWPDMTVRLDRLRGAIDIARRIPASVQRRSAADAVGGIKLTRGALTVLWHSVIWQYLTPAEQHAVDDGIEVLGGQADERSPFAHLSLEPRRRVPGARHQFLLRSRSWPDRADHILARGSPHGPPVNWE